MALESLILAASTAIAIYQIPANPVYGNPPSDIRLYAFRECFQVELNNTPTWSIGSSPLYSTTMEFPGGELNIEVKLTPNTPGPAQDILTVTPSAGWTSEPPSVEVDEGAKGVVMVCPVALS